MKSLEIAQILNKAMLLRRKMGAAGTKPELQKETEELIDRLKKLNGNVLEERWFRTLNNRALKMFVDDPDTLESERRLTEMFNRFPKEGFEYGFAKYLLIKTDEN